VVATADGVGKGSGRSVNGLDLGSAVIAARQAGLLINGGGHAMAAGFSVAADRVGDLAAFLNERVASAAGGPIVPLLEIDGAIAGAAVTPELAQMVGRLAPFGAAVSRALPSPICGSCAAMWSARAMCVYCSPATAGRG
jgi:single-stranded-DNA-specific exonuclease